MKSSEKALALIRKWEGLRTKAYRCSAGKLTIGYGHTENVRAGDRIDANMAEALLRADVSEAERTVKTLVTKSLSQSQFDALVVFVFNIGEPKFSSSALLRKLNKGDYAGAAEEFPKWNKARNPNTRILETSNGLTNRRHDERSLFLS